ncbi:response regulator transcription factor [Caulobacter sp.]|uniref:response regulator transcription factor n=1 Tax=Caulobacter sp. TaxID=78 RepID=UPI002B48E701|nr:response regulator transcription factor [Caulobacter sp.]HJV40398.1 response regulator transcription factor [Caulobacter sp.]
MNGHQDPEPPRLTPAQRRVLAGVNSGLLNKQIAYDLGISEATVKSHMTALMRKLKVRNRTQAAMAARRMTLVVSHGLDGHG